MRLQVDCYIIVYGVFHYYRYLHFLSSLILSEVKVMGCCLFCLILFTTCIAICEMFISVVMLKSSIITYSVICSWSPVDLCWIISLKASFSWLWSLFLYSLLFSSFLLLLPFPGWCLGSSVMGRSSYASKAVMCMLCMIHSHEVIVILSVFCFHALFIIICTLVG